MTLLPLAAMMMPSVADRGADVVKFVRARCKSYACFAIPRPSD